MLKKLSVRMELQPLTSQSYARQGSNCDWGIVRINSQRQIELTQQRNRLDRSPVGPKAIKPYF